MLLEKSSTLFTVNCYFAILLKSKHDYSNTLEPLEEYKQPQEELFELPDLESAKPLFTKICCPSCNKEMPGDHINIHDKIAKCGDCNVVFPFQNMIKGREEPQKVKQDILRPEGIDLFYYKDELELTFRKSFSPLDIVFSVVGFQLSLTTLIIGVGSGASFIGMLIALLPISFLIFFLIQRFRQKMHLSINDRRLIIYSKPNFLSKNRSYRIQDINQVFVKKETTAPIWSVMMMIDEGKGQKPVKLSTLKSASKAKFLEQEIERHLGIQNVDVPGEVK